MIRVVNVRGLSTPELRAGVVYVGRAFAGWSASPWGNPFKPQAGFDAVCAYGRRLAEIRTRDPDGFDRNLFLLLEQTEYGAKPLGCWCVEAVVGFGPSTRVCHAQLIAECLVARFADLIQDRGLPQEATIEAEGRG